MFFKNSHILVQQSCFVRKLQKSRTNLILQSLDKILLWRKPNNYKRALMFNLFKILVQSGTEWKSLYRMVQSENPVKCSGMNRWL